MASAYKLDVLLTELAEVGYPEEVRSFIMSTTGSPVVNNDELLVMREKFNAGSHSFVDVDFFATRINNAIVYVMSTTGTVAVTYRPMGAGADNTYTINAGEILCTGAIDQTVTWLQLNPSGDVELLVMAWGT